MLNLFVGDVGIYYIYCIFLIGISWVPINFIICLSGYGEVGTLQSLACLAIENLVRKSLDQVGLGGGDQNGGDGDDHNDVGNHGDGVVATTVLVMIMLPR